MYMKRTISSHLISLGIVVLVTLSVGVKPTDAGLTLNDQSGDKGSMATFTVFIDSAPNEVAALGFDVRYDPSVLRYRGYSAGPLAVGFDYFGANNAFPGTVRVGGFVAGPNTISQGASGTAVSLSFEIVGHDNCQVSLAQLKDGIKGWSAQPGYFAGDLGVEEKSAGNLVASARGQAASESLTDIRSREDTYHHQVDQPAIQAGGLNYSVYPNPDIRHRTPASSRVELSSATTKPVRAQQISPKMREARKTRQNTPAPKLTNKQKTPKIAKPGKAEYHAVSDLNNLPEKGQPGSHVKTPLVAISYNGTTKADNWYVLAGTMILFGSLCYMIIGLSILLVGCLFWKLIKMGTSHLIAK